LEKFNGLDRKGHWVVFTTSDMVTAKNFKSANEEAFISCRNSILVYPYNKNSVMSFLLSDIANKNKIFRFWWQRNYTGDWIEWCKII